MTRTLSQLLAEQTMPGDPALVATEPDGALRCLACGHRCRIAEGKTGVCRVRFRRDGQIHGPAGYVAGLQVDPIEKKPFYHVLPGRDALSFGMLGCDFHCAYCQNWITSQALRDDDAGIRPHRISPEQIVELARQHHTPVIVSTYNEPLITADWAMRVFRIAREHDLLCGFISNGNATPEVLEFIRPCVQLYKVDLKSFQDRHYRKLGGTLSNVLDTIARLKAMDFWIEIVTLLVPGFNDHPDELRRMADFIASVSRDIPWHVTAFHPDYQMTEPPPTPPEALYRAYRIGREAGLHFVYTGNLPGRIDGTENTQCQSCGTPLIERIGFHVRVNHMHGPQCPNCHAEIPGVWDDLPAVCENAHRRPHVIRLR